MPIILMSVLLSIAGGLFGLLVGVFNNMSNPMFVALCCAFVTGVSAFFIMKIFEADTDGRRYGVPLPMQHTQLRGSVLHATIEHNRYKDTSAYSSGSPIIYSSYDHAHVSHNYDSHHHSDSGSCDSSSGGDSGGSCGD